MTDSRRGQFDGEWQPVQASTDRRHGGGVALGEDEVRSGRPRSVDEKANRVGRRDLGNRRIVVPGGQPQGRDRQVVLRREVQHGLARGEDREPGARREEVGDKRRRVGQLFEVIQHEQHLALPQEIDAAVPQVGRLPMSLSPRARAIVGRKMSASRMVDERDEMDTVGEIVLKIGRDLEREAGLADAARTGQREQTDIVSTHEVDERGQLPLTADEWRERRGEAHGWGGGEALDTDKPLHREGDLGDGSNSGWRLVSCQRGELAIALRELPVVMSSRMSCRSSFNKSNDGILIAVPFPLSTWAAAFPETQTCSSS